MHYVIRDKSEQAAVSEKIRQLNLEKGPFDVEIKRKIKRRSLPLNSTYWLWLTAIGIKTGHSKDELHRHFSRMYLPHRTDVIMGKEQDHIWSTSEFENGQFITYMELIQRDVAEEVGVEWPSSPLFPQFHEQYRGRVA